jgi:thiosulfate/3-mercaptopyruvate sulfurtransferase
MTDMTDTSRFLVSADWLAKNLHDPQLRVFDCSVRLIPDPEQQYRVEDCRWDYRDGHVPGAGYIDLHNELSDKGTRLRFMLPGPEHFAAAMSRYGVDDSTRVVLYAKSTWYWAARVWWMLRAYGFDNAALLDGGWSRWQAEGRPVSTGDERYPAGAFVARPRPGLFCGKQDVLAAIDDPDSIVVNALTPEQHAGSGGTTFSRPGHITNSINVSAKELVDPSTNLLLPLDALRERFAAAGVLSRPRTIVYCGGGIAATGDAFALTLLGQEGVSVYDASLNEWGQDPSLPMQTGA